jgi:hypothetical protein
MFKNSFDGSEPAPISGSLEGRESEHLAVTDYAHTHHLCRVGSRRSLPQKSCRTKGGRPPRPSGVQCANNPTRKPGLLTPFRDSTLQRYGASGKRNENLASTEYAIHEKSRLPIAAHDPSLHPCATRYDRSIRTDPPRRMKRSSAGDPSDRREDRSAFTGSGLLDLSCTS